MMRRVGYKGRFSDRRYFISFFLPLCRSVIAVIFLLSGSSCFFFLYIMACVRPLVFSYRPSRARPSFGYEDQNKKDKRKR